MGEPASHEEIAEKFQELRDQAAQNANRLNDLAAERMEHDAVIKALAQLQPDRKCFRLVGEVLVERTVKEVLPAVKGNREQIEMVEGKLREQLENKKKEISDFQEKYQIRVRSQADVEEEQQEQRRGGDKENSKAQGVLV